MSLSVTTASATDVLASPAEPRQLTAPPAQKPPLATSAAADISSHDLSAPPTPYAASTPPGSYLSQNPPV